MPEASEQERRAGDRAPITLRVDYKRLNTFFADYTKNISKGGTFIKTGRALEVGTEFMFVLSLPSAQAAQADEGGAKETVQLALRGVVKWVVSEADATEEKPAGMGIQFVFEDEGERRAVETKVAEMMREALGPHLAGKILGGK